MSEQSTFAVFSNVGQAKLAMADLLRHGLSKHQVTVISRELESKQEVHGYVSGTDQDTKFALEGWIAGGLVGLALGGVVSGLLYYTGYTAQLGVMVVLAVLAVFVAAGMIVGALVGGMSGRGIKEGRIERFDTELRAGKSMVVAHGTAAEMREAEEVLRGSGAEETHLNPDVLAPADTTEAV